eukprot:TRINITY_DN19350_c0_g1_i1.p2 TRINITY_DN19350_c0_g1~~TRINITY_DN19350_c0_g1_i1.p2  ORF type:complete len:236 (+),score=24.83 TRINITY_DN19350_c0_g1_i1:58-708(+)
MLALLVCLSHCVGQPSPTDGDDVTDAQSLGQLLAGGFVALASVGCLIAYCWYAERKHRGAAEHEATVELDTVQVAAEEPVAESADERETSAVLSAVLSREGTSHCSSVAGREEEVRCPSVASVESATLTPARRNRCEFRCRPATYARRRPERECCRRPARARTSLPSCLPHAGCTARCATRPRAPEGASWLLGGGRFGILCGSARKTWQPQGFPGQ